MNTELRQDFFEPLDNLISEDNPDTFQSIGLYTVRRRLDKFNAFKIDLATTSILDFLKNSLMYLRTQYDGLRLDAFPAGDPKTFIDVLDFSNRADDDASWLLITSLNNAFQNPETDNQTIENYKSGTIIQLKHNDISFTFFKAHSALRSFKKNYIYPVLGNQLSELTTAYLNLSFHFDGILINNKLFLITTKAEKFFNLEERVENIIETFTNTLTNFPNSNITKNDLEEAFKHNPTLCRSFHLQTWNALVEFTENITPDKQEKLTALGFQFDQNGVIQNSAESIQTFCKIVTRKIAFDIFNTPVKTNSNFQPVTEN